MSGPRWGTRAVCLAGVCLVSALTAPPLGPFWWRLVIGIAVAAQLLPVLAVFELPRPVPPARLWIAMWLGVFFVSDVSQSLISATTGNSNLWFFLVANPVEDAALLIAYSYWQLKPVMRLSFRIAVPLLALATLAIAIGFEEVDKFKTTSSPFRLLLLTSAVAYTLVVRAANETERIWDRDWMWTSLGALLYTAAYVVVDPVSAALYPERPDLARLVYVVKAVVDTLAYVMVWKGMRCPIQTPSASSSEPYLRLQ